jgi:hypothetical protein
MKHMLLLLFLMPITSNASSTVLTKSSDFFLYLSREVSVNDFYQKIDQYSNLVEDKIDSEIINLRTQLKNECHGTIDIINLNNELQLSPDGKKVLVKTSAKAVCTFELTEL